MDPPKHNCCTSPSASPRPLLIVVEGRHDVAFLQQLSRRLSPALPHVPDLFQLSAAGRLIFIPIGGGDLAAWTTRLAPLGCAEFHLYDREQCPETALREQVVPQICQRPGCFAALTRKRALENYLSPLAIASAAGTLIDYGDDDAVTDVLARQWFQQRACGPEWQELTHRCRKRLMNHAKRWLNTVAVQHMTPALLAERDPVGEVLGWFRQIAAMAEPCPLSAPETQPTYSPLESLP